MVINKLICNRLFMERKILTTNYPYEVTIFTANSWKLIAIRDLRWLNWRPVCHRKECFFIFPFTFLAFFFLFIIKNFVFIIFISFLDEVYIEFRQQNINQSKTRICELNEVCGNYVWILKCVNLHCNWISLISVLSFPKQWVADYRCVFRTVKQLRWSV